MMMLIKIICTIAIYGLFLHEKLEPHSQRLTGRHADAFRTMNRLYAPALSWLRGRMRPVGAGNKLSIDTAPLVLLSAFLLPILLF